MRNIIKYCFACQEHNLFNPISHMHIYLVHAISLSNPELNYINVL